MFFYFDNVFNVKPLEKPLEFPIYVYENNKYGKPPERIPQLMTVAPDVEYITKKWDYLHCQSFHHKPWKMYAT